MEGNIYPTAYERLSKDATIAITIVILSQIHLFAAVLIVPSKQVCD